MLSSGYGHDYEGSVRTYDDSRVEPIPVPQWMMQNALWPQLLGSVRHSYNVHTGKVNIPGFTRGSRIISTKVPPMYHTEHDGGAEY